MIILYFFFVSYIIALVPGSSYYSCWPTKSSSPQTLCESFSAWHKQNKKKKKQKTITKTKTLQTAKPSLCPRCHTLRIRHVIAQISFRRIGQQIPCTPATRSACKSHTPRADFIYTVHDNHPPSQSIPHAVYDGHNCSSRSLSAQPVDCD